jgi:hypothetical protein
MMERFLIQVAPGLSSYLQRLDVFKRSLLDIVRRCTSDLSISGCILSELTGSHHSTALSSVVSALVKDLQSLDLIAQRLTHIIMITDLLSSHHDEDNERRPMPDEAGFIFKLNLMQLKVASNTLAVTINNIKKRIDMINGMATSRPPREMFSQLDLVQTSLIEAGELMSEVMDERLCEVPLGGSVGKNVLQVGKVYTMESERQMLHCVFSTPAAHPDELLATFYKRNWPTTEEGTELF